MRAPQILLLPIVLIVAFAVLQGRPATVHAHKKQQLRIFHIIIKGQQIECYINFLLPKSPKSRLWRRMFDRNRDRRMSTSEQHALGKFLRRLVQRKLTIKWQGKPLVLRFREVQNSRLRGDPLKGVLSWDYRFSARAPSNPQDQMRHLVVHAPPLAPGEMTPIALVALGGERLKATKDTYVLRRAGVDRGVCKLHKKRRTCHFALRPRAKAAGVVPRLSSTRPALAPRPTSRPAGKRAKPGPAKD